MLKEFKTYDRFHKQVSIRGWVISGVQLKDDWEVAVMHPEHTCGNYVVAFGLHRWTNDWECRNLVCSVMVSLKFHAEDGRDDLDNFMYYMEGSELIERDLGAA